MIRRRVSVFIVCLAGLAFFSAGCASARRAGHNIVQTPQKVDNWIKENMW